MDNRRREGRERFEEVRFIDNTALRERRMHRSILSIFVLKCIADRDDR